MNAVIGVDPGWRYTAGVLRVGDDVIDGFTLGPVGTRKANDLMAPAAMDAYTDQIGAALDDLWDQAVELGHTPRVAVEMPTVPIGNKSFVAKWRAYKITNDVAWYVKGRFNAVRVRADGNGNRHKAEYGGTGNLEDHYPAALIRRRQLRGPGEAPRNERDHERAAYDVAGHLLPNVGQRSAA
jgi:hypothetical protein